MREFEQKRNNRKILSSPFILAPLAVAFLFLARSTWNIYLKDKVSSGDLGQAEDRLASSENRQALITGDIAKLQTETGVESEIRDKLQMGKEGEKEVVILDDVSPTTTTASAADTGILQKIWDFFTIR